MTSQWAQLTVEDVTVARRRIARYVRVTPVLSAIVPTPGGPVDVVLKLESLQITGSSKPRGAFNSLLQSNASAVVACSGGNHGLAVAHAARVLGKEAIIVVPASAAATKVEAMRRAGADVRLEGDVPAEAFALAERIAAERDWPMIHPYDQPATIAGQGTLGLELLEQAPSVTHWLVAVGGGGFPAGVALALGHNARLVPVEPEGCPGLYEAQAAGTPVPVKAEGIARTSLGAPSLGGLAWDLLQHQVGRCVLVSDEHIAGAQRWLWEYTRVVAEPGGATGLAALTSGAWTPPPGASVGVVICGGNADLLPH